MHCAFTPWQTWQRPTLPRLETEYHRRWGVSRPSSEWDRVQPPRNSHQVDKRVKANWSGISTGEFSPPIVSTHRGARRPRRATRQAGSRVAAQARALGPDEHCINESDQANRAISTGKLHTLRCFHTRPINVVVFHGSQGSTRFEVGFPLRCIQRLSRPYIATLHCGWRHNSSTRGTSIPVLSY